MGKDSTSLKNKIKPWMTLLAILAFALIFAIPCVLFNVQLGYYLIFPGIIFIISACLLIREYKRINGFKVGKWGVSSVLYAPKGLYLKFMGSIMGICFSAGCALNILALWCGEQGNMAKVLVHGAIAAFELFFLDINEDIFQEMNTVELFQPHWRHLIEGGIIVVSVLSTICMFSLLVNLFLTRISAWIHSCWVKVRADKNNQLYIFFGVGEKEMTLAGSIRDDYENRNDPNYMIIFVDTQNDDEEKHNNWENIISFLTVNNPVVPRINQEKHCFYLVSDAGFDKADKEKPDNFWRIMGLSKIQKRINELAKISRKNCSVKPELHFFFLSDDRNQNVDDTRILADYLSKDNEIKEIPKVIYCQTRKSSVTSIIEDSRSNPDVKLEVRVIDESVLAVERLKEKEVFHPSHYVEFELDDVAGIGFAKTPFNSLIVGFGETGRDALRFLYEYGAFIDADKEEYERSPFSCHVIDKKEESGFHHFISRNPAIRKHSSINQTDDGRLINFYQCSDISRHFYDLLERISSGLNYVVISTGDEENNIAIAVNILKYVRTKRKDLRNFVILVRAYEENSFNHINKIAVHYNNILKGESGGNKVIHVFGNTREIFRYDTIVNSAYKKEGVDYYETYSKAYHKTEQGSRYPILNWEDRRSDVLSKNSLAKTDDLRRKESQDYSNAWHALTKRVIMRKALSHLYGDTLEEDILKTLSERMFSANDGIPAREWHEEDISYPTLDKQFGDIERKGVSRLITNMAIMEHARWVAAHEMLGYSYREDIRDYHVGKPDAEKERDDIRKHHPCMVEWDRLPLLPEKYERLYDYLVVETTLRLMLDNGGQKSL